MMMFFPENSFATFGVTASGIVLKLSTCSCSDCDTWRRLRRWLERLLIRAWSRSKHVDQMWDS